MSASFVNLLVLPHAGLTSFLRNTSLKNSDTIKGKDKRLIVPLAPEKPKPSCMVCSKAQLTLRVNVNTMTLGQLLATVGGWVPKMFPYRLVIVLRASAQAQCSQGHVCSPVFWRFQSSKVGGGDDHAVSALPAQLVTLVQQQLSSASIARPGQGGFLTVTFICATVC